MVVVVMIRCRKLAGRSDASNGRAAIASTQNKLRGKITRYELLIAISTVVQMWALGARRRDGCRVRWWEGAAVRGFVGIVYMRDTHARLIGGIGGVLSG